MPYQQTGTPRFYVSVLQWLNSIGNLTSYVNFPNGTVNLENKTPSQLVEINPTSQASFIGDGSEAYIYFENDNNFSSVMPNDKNFVMWLGHNFASSAMSIALKEIGDNAIADNEVVVNSNQAYDGFSVSIGNDGHDATQEIIYIRFKDYTPSYEFKLGSFLYGTYYDMPHSPDLNLSLSYDYSGVKEITTRGGASLSNSFYSKSADWGTLGAWELKKPDVENDPDTEEDETLTVAQTNQKLSRSGRRVWDLSFSYLSQEDTFPKYNQLTTLETDDEPTGYTGETATSSVNILPSSDDFYSQVIHKTNGGQLPFIFQPNKDDNTNFAIAKFDQNSFTLQQTAPNLYSVKCRIKEVW